MALLQDLIRQIEDPVLRDRITAETDKLLKQKKFGLVFEEHLPECTPLYEVPVRVGGMVAKKTGYVSDIYFVTKIEGEAATCVNRETREESVIPLDELVTIVQFGEPIYPYLKPIDTVCNAPDSDLWHTLIEADNYHALQLLEYLYAGKVDCIYIDPPYNTGAKDWKYNNDYVDGSDTYRHSKWLSMMEKRLKIAKKLLNPNESVMIIAIDEKEQCHLGCLIEELFPDSETQMITIVSNPKGSVRAGRFTRCDEYLYYIFIGNGKSVACDSDNLFESTKLKVRWPSLKRTGTNSRRASYKSNAFYPIFYDKETGKYKGIGDSLPPGVPRESIPIPPNTIAVWPLDNNGGERIWQLFPDSFLELSKLGYIDYGTIKNGTASPYYVSTGLRSQIENGEIIITGRDEQGVVKLEYTDGSKKESPKTTWNVTAHSASEHGSNMLMSFFLEKRFTYPKSLYAVRDSLQSIVRNKPNALIVDFFAGSGTTLHAVNLLNAEDGGQRRCILVTNNEVSADEAKELSKQGFKPGDPEWERLGIAHYVTWERTRCSIEGHDVNGQPLKGNYLGSDLPMADGFKANAAFFKLGFLDKTRVALGAQFKELLPVLWMKSNAVGACPTLEGDDLPDMLILPQNHFAVLLEEPSFKKFSEELAKHPEIDTVFIVTDSVNAYREMIRSMDGKETYQLYRDYLDNFRINTGR